MDWNLNVRSETMKLPGENIGANKVNKWDCIKLKSPAKETNEMQRKLQNGEDICKSYI